MAFIKLWRILSRSNSYRLFLSRRSLSSNTLITSASYQGVFFRFGSGEPLNRARWHVGRSRQSPTCYHRCRQRIVKPRIVHQLRVTPRIERSSSRAKIAAIRGRRDESTRSVIRIESFEFFFFRIFATRYSNEKEIKNLIYIIL